MHGGGSLSIPISPRTMNASGADGILAKILKETAVSIAPAISKLFNISLMLGELPAEWKHALITPIPNQTRWLLSVIIDQFLYYLCSVKYWNDMCIHCF